VFIIDRFEGEWVVIEADDVKFNLPRRFLPSEAREGDVLRITVEIDSYATKERREKIKNLEDRLFK